MPQVVVRAHHGGTQRVVNCGWTTRFVDVGVGNQRTERPQSALEQILVLVRRKGGNAPTNQVLHTATLSKKKGRRKEAWGANPTPYTRDPPVHME
jgi:hypothetical protein